MAVLRHRKACSVCPFRRSSAPGYLGASRDPLQFTQAALADFVDHDLPCHATVDYGRDDWSTDDSHAACAGALIFAKNGSKQPRDPRRAAMVQGVETDDEVFSWSHEFHEHHKNAARL